MLKHDFRAQTLVELYRTQQRLQQDACSAVDAMRCQLCNKKQFVCRCVDCGKFMCKSCQNAHDSIPTCSGHDVIAIESALQESRQILEKVHDNFASDKRKILFNITKLSNSLEQLENEHVTAINRLDEIEAKFLEKI